MSDISSEDDWAKIFTGSPTDAEMVRGVLEGSGIAAIIKRLGGGAYGLDPGPLGETTVYVRSTDEAPARELLDEVEAAPVDDDWAEDPSSTPMRSSGMWIMRLAAIVVIAVLLYEATQ